MVEDPQSVSDPRVHWSIQDPSAATGTEADRLAAFQRAAEELMTRVRYLIAIAETKADRKS